MVGSQEWEKPLEQKYNQARLTLIIGKISPIFSCCGKWVPGAEEAL